MSERASAAKAETRPKPVATPEPELLDLSAEYQSADQVAQGEWTAVQLPNSGNPFPVLVARAVGPHFEKAMAEVHRKLTKAGRKEFVKLPASDQVQMKYEVMARACFLDFKPHSILLRIGNNRVEIRHNTVATRLQLLENLPDFYQQLDELCGLAAVDFAEAVKEAGEG